MSALSLFLHDPVEGEDQQLRLFVRHVARVDHPDLAVAQAEALDRILEKSGEAVTACVSLMIPDALIHERIAHRATIEGRADDARPEVVENRIKTYHAKTEPLIAFYKQAGKYQEVDGVGSIDTVRDRIFSVMDRF